MSIHNNAYLSEQLPANRQFSFLWRLLSVFIFAANVLATDTVQHSHADALHTLSSENPQQQATADRHPHEIKQAAVDQDEHDEAQIHHKAHEHHKEQTHHEVHAHNEEHAEHEAAELKFSPAELEEFSIKLAQAQAGEINTTLELTGEVIVAPERLYHVVPSVSGVVRQVYKHLGDRVKAGDLLATLSSRDLADAKAQFVAANSLLQLANASLKRVQNLYHNKVTAKRELLIAQQTYAEMSINRQAAKQRLQAIGLTDKGVSAVLKNGDNELTLYELRAPAEGIIIEQHAVQGEVLETHLRSFTIADLSSVWVSLTVYQKDLPFIHKNQQIIISTRFGLADKEATALSIISWLSPTLDKTTRSATARVIIDNPEGYWRPGLFVSGKVAIAKTAAAIVIPLPAVQTLDGQSIVFIKNAEGHFSAQPVKTGRNDHRHVEVLQGLKPGQTYISQNAFTLKAQMQKGSFGHGHSH